MWFRSDTLFISVFAGAVPQELCREIIRRFEDDPRRAPGKTCGPNDSHELDESKVSTDLTIDEEWAGALWQPFHAGITQSINTYIASMPALQVAPIRWTPYKIQAYEAGAGKFDWHMDALAGHTLRRQLGLLCYLNTVARGGETEFYHQRLAVTPKAGAVAIFPASWTHMHRGKVPTSSKKYVVSSFVEFNV